MDISPSLGLFTCSSLQGSLRPSRLMTLSFPLVEGGLSGEVAGWGGAAEAGLKFRLQILGPVEAVEAGEQFQLLLRGLDGWEKEIRNWNIKPFQNKLCFCSK